jgi:CHRD domain-containing protein
MRQRRIQLVAAVAIVSIVSVVATTALAGNGKNAKAKLDGYQELSAGAPPGGPISTLGNGKFKAKIRSNEIQYTLSYRDLEGGGVLAAHIHFGRRAVNGGISAFLCGGGTKPPCPPSPATVTGTIVPSDVIGPAAQGIAPGEFDELVRAMRARATYANVHTMTYPNGEIRGQIKAGGDD